MTRSMQYTPVHLEGGLEESEALITETPSPRPHRGALAAGVITLALFALAGAALRSSGSSG